MENEIIGGASWAHKRDGYKVTIADLGFDKIRTKDADDAAWQRAVAYTVDGGDVEEGDSHLLVRTEKDFRDRFVHLSDNESGVESTTKE